MPPPIHARSWFGSVSSRLADPDKRVNFIGVALAVGVTAMLGVMGARVAQLQLKPSEKLAAHMSDRRVTVVEPARRADITDRRDRVLAASHFASHVVIDPEQFPTKNTDEAIVKLAAALGVKAEEIGPKILSRMAANQEKKAEYAAKKGAKDAATKAKGAATESTSLAQSGEPGGTRAPVDPLATVPMDGGDDEIDAKPALARYVPIGGILEDGRVDVVKALKIPGVHLETRQVRVMNDAEIAATLVGKVGFGDKGLMGSEKLLDKPLQPRSGTFTFTADVHNRPLWIEPDAYKPPVRGQDTALSIDLEIQRIVEEELDRGVVEADAAGGRAVVMDPATGEILAMVDIMRDIPGIRDYDWKTPLHKDEPPVPGQRWRIIPADKARDANPALGRNRCVEDIYEPGSTFKAFMWAAVTELQLAKPKEVINTYNGVYKVPYGSRWVRDVHGKSSQTWQEVLVNSSNIGMTLGCARMSFEEHYNAIRKFGFGTRPHTNLPGETAGIVTPLSQWTNWTQTSCSYGYQVGVTPVQVARAFCALSRVGDENGVLPPARFLAVSNGQKADVEPKRVLPRWTADITRETLRGVTASLDRKLAAKQVPEKDWKYELYGKSGTAQAVLGMGPMDEHGVRAKPPKGGDGYYPQYNASFVAGGPAEAPRLVMIVVIDDPGPDLVRKKEHRGASVAGPVVRRSLERCLTYLSVPPSPPLNEELKKRNQD
jgi:cell division protein FtsI (penicillin-binding protein 3)